MQITVNDMMTSPAASIDQSGTISEALTLMCRENVDELYVTASENRLLGVVPDYELFKAQLNGMPAKESVEMLMTAHMPTISAESAIAETIPQFRTGRCRRMAVVRDGRLVGQVGRRDVMRLLTTLEALDAPTSTSNDSTDIPRPRYLTSRSRTDSKTRPASGPAK